MDIEDRIANNLGKTLNEAAKQMKRETTGYNQMYLVLMVQHNRVFHAKAFRNFDLATYYADQRVIDQIGLTDNLPDWENGDYCNVFDAPNGVSIMIEPCDKPEEIDPRFQGQKYGVNYK